MTLELDYSLAWDLYQAYQASREDAQAALEDWRRAPWEARAERFTVYRAAAEREDAAMEAWQRASERYDNERRAS